MRSCRMQVYCYSVIMNRTTFLVWAINQTVVNLLTGKELVARMFLIPCYLSGDQIYPSFALCIPSPAGILIYV